MRYKVVYNKPLHYKYFRSSFISKHSVSREEHIEAIFGNFSNWQVFIIFIFKKITYNSF